MQIIPTDQNADIQQAKLRLGIVGNAPALIAAISRAIQVAPIDLSVLIVGESGTGKEFFPKIIHQFSARKHSKYIAVNCGAIPEGTIDSELFGHEKGAFTSAISARKGYFEEADGGTIFLDEVAELPLTTQARLLRVLESGEFIKVGSSTVQKTNIRIVAATNVDMAKAIKEGRFREDLFYRLSGVQIPIPPLRDRGNDILLLARKFATDSAERYQLPAIAFDDNARRLMLTYRWPGNVRQLKNIIEQISIFEAGSEISEDILRGYLPENTCIYTPAVTGEKSDASPHSYMQERELLFNLIFRMQHEIDQLRSMIEDKKGFNGNLTDAVEIENTRETVAKPVTSIVAYRPALSPVQHIEPVQRAIDDEQVSPVNSLTLEETEKETIRRALERNDGRRKAAAKELNISERTLYRKIKEYDLE